jgi:hypothetical protein
VHHAMTQGLASLPQATGPLATARRQTRLREALEASSRPNKGDATAAGCVCEREARADDLDRGPRESGARPRALGRRDFPPPVRSTAGPGGGCLLPRGGPPLTCRAVDVRLRSRAHAPASSRSGIRRYTAVEKKPIMETRAALSFSPASCLFYYVYILLLYIPYISY